MSSALTLFTTCKPFEREFATLQRNALRSWKAACPECEVLVFGDEAGVAECCRQLGLQHVAKVARTQLGTPLLNDLFEQAEALAKTEFLAFVNSDIMLTDDLLVPAEAARSRFSQFLLIARRWNVSLQDMWDFTCPEWQLRLRQHAHDRGTLEPPYGGIDLFLYSRGIWGQLPPFAVGRTRWDSALIYQARRREIPVIDATDSLTTVHQNHSYAHYPKGAPGVFKGPEALRNQELLGGEQFIFTALNATHVLKNSSIQRRIDFYPPYLMRKIATVPALYPSLGFLAPVVRYLAPWWRNLRQLNSRATKRGEPS